MQQDQMITMPINRRVAALMAEDDELAGNDIGKGMQIIANLRYREILESEKHTEEEVLLVKAHHDLRGLVSPA